MFFKNWKCPASRSEFYLFCISLGLKKKNLDEHFLSILVDLFFPKAFSEKNEH